jgi:autotransporter-associated beta strand protein
MYGNSAAIVTDNGQAPGTSRLFVNAPGGYNIYDGTISDGAGGRKLSLEIGGGGQAAFLLGGDNTYTGGTMIDSDTQLVLNSVGSIAGNVTVAAGSIFWFAQAENLTFSGNVALGNGACIYYGWPNATLGTLTLSGVISGSGSVAQLLPSVLTLSGDNTYTGGTTVSGTLIVGSNDALGTGSVTVCFSGTLQLNGYYSSVGAFLLCAGGAVMPGGPSILTTGDFALSSGGQYVVAIDGSTAGTSYSQTQVVGQVSLGYSTLVLTGSGAGSDSGPIVLIASTSAISDQFVNLPQGATFTYQGVTYQISYDYNPNGGIGNDVALIPV